jgi:chromosome segregation ATPase
MLSVALILPLAACGDDGDGGAEKVKKESKEAYEAAKEYASEQTMEFRNKLEQELDDFDSDLAGLKSKAKNATGDAKEDIERRLDNLEDERAAVKQKLEALENKSGDAWDELKQDAQQAWEALQSEYRELEADIRQSLN